jgi:hypothetical protein
MYRRLRDRCFDVLALLFVLAVLARGVFDA